MNNLRIQRVRTDQEFSFDFMHLMTYYSDQGICRPAPKSKLKSEFLDGNLYRSTQSNVTIGILWYKKRFIPREFLKIKVLCLQTV